MSMKRELRHINRELDRYQRRNGEGVLWYEYHAEDFTPTDYLNEGTKRYLPPIAMPVLWIIETEDTESAQAEGRRLTPTIRFAVSMETLMKSGLSDPHYSERHLNDLVLYQRTLYGIGTYEVKGRMAREDVIVGVNAIKVFPDEDMVFDQPPPGLTPGQTRRPQPVIDDNTGWEIFPDHELPARHS
jgi:hypothetical protein